MDKQLPGLCYKLRYRVVALFFFLLPSSLEPGICQLVTKLKINLSKVDALCQWQLARVIDCAGTTATVLLPAIATAFATSTSLLFSTKRTSNFSSVCRDVNIDDTTIRSSRANPLENLGWVGCEDRAGKTLSHIVVNMNSPIECLKTNKCVIINKKWIH
jgi:hypothetical protein